MATELPEDHNGEPDFTIQNELDKLQQLEELLEVDDLDKRSSRGDMEKRALIKDTIRDRNENDVISSVEVEDLNDKYEVNLDNSNPMFIFPEDRKNMNFVNMIRQSNQSFARERDLLTVPPEADVHQQVLERLKQREMLDIQQKVMFGVRLSQEEERKLEEMLRP